MPLIGQSSAVCPAALTASAKRCLSSSAIVLTSTIVRGGTPDAAMAAAVACSDAEDGRLVMMIGAAYARLETSGCIRTPSRVLLAAAAGSGSYP